ncbi:proteasome maturation protein-like [Lineus longissimus]|uniref:proteasome maturation protein-like n=1 Tax=Lineus longissimus TaxID=88925 RepID=UPI002B4E2774
MINGFKNHASTLAPVHPLEVSEKQWQSTHEKSEFSLLRNTQGIHMPLRLKMERNAAHKVQRLPCLHSSNFMLNTLSKNSELIDFDDFLNNPADAEVMGAPHMMTERQLGLL